MLRGLPQFHRVVGRSDVKHIIQITLYVCEYMYIYLHTYVHIKIYSTQ